MPQWRGPILISACAAVLLGCKPESAAPHPQSPAFDDRLITMPSKGTREQPTITALSPGFWSPRVLSGWVKSHDPNTKPDATRPLILFAQERKDRAAILTLLEAGANVDEADSGGQSALQSAVDEKDEQMAIFLMRHRASPTRLNARRVSALYIAAAYGELQVIKEAIKEGANVNSPAGIAGTAAGRAALTGQIPALDLLLAHGGKFQNSAGMKPMHFAALVGYPGAQYAAILDVPTALSDRQHRIPQLIGHSRSTILYLAKHGMGLDVRDNKGRTPLHLAALADNTEAAQTLIALGANPKLPDNSGLTPAQFARAEGSPNVSHLLANPKGPQAALLAAARQ